MGRQKKEDGVERELCRGKTAKGGQCKSGAGDSGYCKRHINQVPRDAPTPTGPTWVPKRMPKRPDVAKRLKERKNIVETVVKASLPGRIGVDWSCEGRQVLQQELDDWVLTTSKVVHRLSIVFNRLLIHLVKEGKPLPTLEDSFFTGIALSGMKKTKKTSKNGYSALINDFCENEFNVDAGHYPQITRQRGDCQAIAIAAQSKRRAVEYKQLDKKE